VPFPGQRYRRKTGSIRRCECCPSDFSFPSDHATIAGAVAVGLLLAGITRGSHRIGVIAGALAAPLLARDSTSANRDREGRIVAPPGS
jgi:membrane-associated phospholipid phosphatase